MPWYGVSSTRLGSIITILNWTGVRVIKRPVTMVFMQTLLPEPVAPATKVWGILAKSAITGLPPLPMPSGTGKAASSSNSNHSSESITVRRLTGVGLALGTSMPTTDDPGTTDSNLILGEERAKAMSFSRLRMVSTRTRWRGAFERGPLPFQPGLRPYIVTVGPTLT